MYTDFEEPRAFEKRQEQASNKPNQFGCWATLDACNNGTGTCSKKGNCTKQAKYENCFRCDCSKGFLGRKCEFVDRVESFHLVFWTSLGLIVIALSSVSLLFSMDTGKDSWVFAGGNTSRMKKE